MNIRIATATALSFAFVVIVAGQSLRAAPAESPPAATASIPITISSHVPAELNPAGGGAPKASLAQAAAFAWQEFIAMTWPAVPQSGALGQRETPNPQCRYGDPNCTGPLVWETFRSKVEIFPGTGTPPGYVDSAASSYGYDALPQYNYDHPVPACAAATTSPAWINLDETDQITLANMYAGAAPTQSDVNSAPQLIRFTAKGNRAEYAYVAQNKWWTAVDPGVGVATQEYLDKYQASPPPGSSQFVSLPLNTIELKAGWRELNPSEQKSGRFHTAKVRYYKELSKNHYCYREATWGLVALHIIQKTASAPYFIYATFEQADNILTADGKPVEDVNGALIGTLPGCRSDQQAPCPSTPSVTLNDTATVNPNMSGIPPNVTLVPSNAQYCTASVDTPPKNQLYYQNGVNKPALPSDGFICINYRDNLIPPIIVQANQDAHAAIANYNAQQHIPTSPWSYYKLINVQYQAIDKDYAGPYKGNDPSSGHNPENYHLANIVVETNRPLQLFSGGLVQSNFTGSSSDYESQFSRSGASGIHKNIYYAGHQANMGGCMGCHGSQGQHAHGDFSVILATGAVHEPEGPSEPTPTGASQVRRNRVLH